MYVLFLFLHLVIAFLLCVVVLLQRSKGGGLAGAFGGVGAGEAMFGAQGVTTFLHKATIWLAVAFMVSSMGLAILTASRGAGGGEINRSAVRQAVPVTNTPIIDPEAAPVPTEGDAVPPVPSEGDVEGQSAGEDVVPAPVEDSTASEDNGSGDGASEEEQGG